VVHLLPEEPSVQFRSRVADFSLLVVALLSPILYLWGILTDGRAILYYDFARLGVIYLALAIGAAAATYLFFRRGMVIVRLAAGIALLANLGSIAYAELLWRPDMQRAFAEVERRTFDQDQTGILIAAADHSPQAMEEARAIEETIQAIVSGVGLDQRIIVRPTYPIASETQARYVGRDLGASLVIWKTSAPVRDRYTETYHITVLGASPRGIAVDGISLLLAGVLQETLSAPMTRWQSAPADMRLANEVIVPVATGLAFMAENELLLAGGQFEKASLYPDLPARARVALHNYLGATLLLYGRPDLAPEPFERSLAVEPNAAAWVGLGSVAAAQHRWDEAAAAFSRAVTLDPYDASAYCGLGYVHARKRDIHSAYLAYQQAIALEPTSSVPFVFMGLLYELRADLTAAQQAYQEAATRAYPDKGLYAAITGRAEEIRRNPPTPVPTATPKPIPSPTPIPTSALHTVERGNTLQAIANKYGVSINELIEINGIEDPNELYIGQVLLIPPLPD
jgi:tetratricopeptide (TPR) repeat protein